MRGRTLKKREAGDGGTHLVVVEVSIDREAVLALLLPLGLRFAPPSAPPLDQGGVAHAAEEVGLCLQLQLLLSWWPQSGGLVHDRTFVTSTSTEQGGGLNAVGSDVIRGWG